MKPTERQLRFIAEIEKTLKIRFEGKTKKQASDFIKANYNDFKKVPKVIDYERYMQGFRE